MLPWPPLLQPQPPPTGRLHPGCAHSRTRPHDIPAEPQVSDPMGVSGGHTSHFAGTTHPGKPCGTFLRSSMAPIAGTSCALPGQRHSPSLPSWLSGERIRLQCRRRGFGPWVGKFPWRRKWQPTPVLSPGESHVERSLAGNSPWGCKELDTTERLNTRRFLLEDGQKGLGPSPRTALRVHRFILCSCSCF